MPMTVDSRSALELKFKDFNKELTDSYKEDDLLTLFGSKAGVIDGDEAIAFFVKMKKFSRNPATVVSSFEDRTLVNTFLDAPSSSAKTAMHANDHIVQTNSVQWITSPQMFRVYAMFNSVDQMIGAMHIKEDKMIQLHRDVVATHNDMLMNLLKPDSDGTITQWRGRISAEGRKPTMVTEEYKLGETNGNVLPTFTKAPDMDYFADVTTHYRKKRSKPQYCMVTPTMAADIWKLNKEYFTNKDYSEVFCPAEELVKLGKMLPFSSFKFITTNELTDDKRIVFFTEDTLCTTRWKQILDGGKNPEAHFRAQMMHEEHLDVFITDPDSLCWATAA